SGNANVTVTGDGSAGSPYMISSVDNVDDADNIVGNEYNTAFGVSGSNLRLTDGGGNLDVPLSSLGTDSQTLSTNGSAGQVSISGGNAIILNVNDADSVIGNETITSMTYNAGVITVNEGGNTPRTVNISGLNTDNQRVDKFNLNGTTLELSLLRDAEADKTINLGNTFATDAELAASDAADLDKVIGNEYNTAFSISGSNLRLTDGGGNLDVPLANIDTQDLSIDATGKIISLVNGGSVTINADDADASPTNEIQTLSRSGTNISLTNGGGTVSIADNDNNSSNEIQTITSTDGSVTVTPSGINYNLSVAAANGAETIVEAAPNTDISVSGTGTSADPYLIANTRPNIFYPPSIAVDVATTGTGRTIDLHDEYLSQYGTPAVVSAGAPTAIPTYADTDLYYYVTYFDSSVFANVSVAANGVMTYDVIATPTDYNTLINVVFVAK
ncbi:MAG: hypothetical protein WBB24_00455, partial [Maribacter sp.]